MDTSAKLIGISFADHSDPVKYSVYLHESFDHMASNLFARHKIKAEYYTIYAKYFIIQIHMPYEIDGKYNIGYLLRGMSSYLLKNYKDIFSSLRIGTRLFNIEELPREVSICEQNTIDYIYEFIKLIRMPKTAKDKEKVDRICAILDE